MAKTALGVGIIGASADGGWARESHVPAIAATAGLELVAVANRSQASAAAAAEAFGARAAYDDATDLFADPLVDVVTVTAPVAAHREAILGALRAGKHVYSEWPLGLGTPQTDELARAAEQAGVRTAVGLQGRAGPSVQAARDLLAAGAIGRPLSARVVSTTAGFGPVIAESGRYLEDPAEGMNLSTIQVAHTIDLVRVLLGLFATTSALFTTQFPQVQVGDGGDVLVRTNPDHVLVQLRTEAGVPVAVEVAGGRPADQTPFTLEVRGTSATLLLSGGAPRGFQAGRLTLAVDGKPQATDDRAAGELGASAANVAAVYGALVRDVQRGTRTAPDFSDALDLSRLLDGLAGTQPGR